MEDAIILSSAPVAALVMIIVVGIMSSWSRSLVGGIVLLVLVVLGLVLVVNIVCGLCVSGICGRSVGGSGMVILYGRRLSSSNQFVVCMRQGLAMDDCIKSINGVGGVLDGATEAVGIVQGVLALHHITVTGLHLALGVARHGVLHIIGKVVLGMRIIGIDLMGVGVCVNVVRLLVDHMLLLRHRSVIKLWLLVVFHRNKASRYGRD